MDVFQYERVADVFQRYPEPIRRQLLALRQLVLDTARETTDIGPVEETLKWGEPSYLCRGGSTVRMDWKSATPDHYALYFHCTATLVDTFKELYWDTLSFEGNRAIVFKDGAALPVTEVKHCVELALTYHQRTHRPLLGA